MRLRLNLKNHVLNKKEHWETVYGTKTPEEVSWTQEEPKISLDLIHSLSLQKNSKIIDVGGGDSAFRGRGGRVEQHGPRGAF